MPNDQPQYDPQGALTYASTHEKEPGCPCHWLRCEWMYQGRRCRLPDGHPDTQDHVFDPPGKP